MHPSDNLGTDRLASSAGPAETTTDPVPLAQGRLERTSIARCSQRGPVVRPTITGKTAILK